MPDRALASLYIRNEGRAILLDCGEGSQIQIMKLGWGFRCIEAVLLTHYHADHCSGLPGFLLAQAKAGRTEPLPVWGPVGLGRIMDGLRVICPQLPYRLELHEVSGEDAFEAAGLQVQTFPLQHGIPCLGYAFSRQRAPAFLPELARSLEIPVTEWKLLQHGQSIQLHGHTIEPSEVMGPPRAGLSFLYATDTRPTETIVRYGQGTDLMILEGMYGQAEKQEHALKNHHMLYSEAAGLAAQAGTRALVLTHFSTSMEDPAEFLESATGVFPETTCATDGQVFSLRYPAR